MDIRRLSPDDAQPFSLLRAKALREEPTSFSSSPEEHARYDIDSIRQRLAPSPDSFVLGAFDSTGALVGIVGVYRQASAKHAHKASMWGMYVSSAHRRRGIGRTLLDAAIHETAALPGIELLCTSVFLTAAAARDLYLSRGFSSWGIQPRSARIDAAYISEEHLLLELRDWNDARA